MAKAHNITALLQVPYHLIGQTPATTTVLESIIGHIALGSEKPLVLVYAGPSGDGKTELATQMGDLMSVDTLVVDCTEMQYETDMFGMTGLNSRPETILADFICRTETPLPGLC